MALPPIDRTLDGRGKTVIFRVISMDNPEPETSETVTARIRAALEHLPPERLIAAPDCGMKYISADPASPWSGSRGRPRSDKPVHRPRPHGGRLGPVAGLSFEPCW